MNLSLTAMPFWKTGIKSPIIQRYLARLLLGSVIYIYN